MADCRHFHKDDDVEKLDFYEAMRDFKSMFPTLAESVIETVLRSNHGAVDDTIDQLLIIATDADSDELLPTKVNCPSPEPPPYSAAASELLDFLNSPSFSSSNDLRPLPTTFLSKKRIFNPPMVGKLPSDFLRLTPLSPSDSDSDLADRLQYDCPPPLYDNVVQKRHQNFGGRPSNMAPPVAHLGIFRSSPVIPNSTTKLKRYKTLDSSLLRQSEVLKEKMAENEWRRQLTNDPELERYLEDERVALLLQNEEFLLHLKSDRSFLAALERDTRKSNCRHEKIPMQKRSESLGGASSSLKADSAAYSSHDSQDVFPYTKVLEKSNDNEVAFGEKLKYMGKTSKRKFAILARKFIRKQKGAEGMIGKSDSYYSDVALLADADTDNERDMAYYEAAGYNQPDDHAYNISHTTDLKEGRLFSR